MSVSCPPSSKTWVSISIHHLTDEIQPLEHRWQIEGYTMSPCRLLNFKPCQSHLMRRRSLHLVSLAGCLNGLAPGSIQRCINMTGKEGGPFPATSHFPGQMTLHTGVDGPLAGMGDTAEVLRIRISRMKNLNPSYLICS